MPVRLNPLEPCKTIPLKWHQQPPRTTLNLTSYAIWQSVSLPKPGPASPLRLTLSRALTSVLFQGLYLHIALGLPAVPLRATQPLTSHHHPRMPVLLWPLHTHCAMHPFPCPLFTVSKLNLQPRLPATSWETNPECLHPGLPAPTAMLLASHLPCITSELSYEIPARLYN